MVSSACSRNSLNGEISSSSKISPISTFNSMLMEKTLIRKREADPIEYYISDDYIAVEGETSLKEIIATIDYDVSGIIPVIQHDRKLLGYLTKSIILATMSKQFVPEHTAGERSGVICPATL